MAVGAEMSGVLTKIHVIPYVIPVKPSFGTKANYPHTHTLNFCKLILLPNKNSKRKPKNFLLPISPFYSFMSFLVLTYATSPSPIWTD